MKITITRKDLDLAAEKEIISEQQANNLWEMFGELNKSKVNFTGLTVAYYFGALIIISAMIWFGNEVYSRYQAAGLFFVGILYFMGFLVLGKKLYSNIQSQIPGGLLLSSAVFMIPLIVFSLQDYFLLWENKEPGSYREFYAWIKNGWFLMEISAIITALIFLFKYKFAFISSVVVYSLWYLSLDAAPLIFNLNEYTIDHRKMVTMIFGFIVLLFTYFVDRRTKTDYAFWLYLSGLLFFWGALSLMDSDSELNKFNYFSINILLVIVSVLFSRKVFIFFGAAGVYVYLYHLSDIVFRDSLFFPVALSFLGISIIWLGVKYNRNKEVIDNYINSLIPKSLTRLLPPHRLNE